MWEHWSIFHVTYLTSWAQVPPKVWLIMAKDKIDSAQDAFFVNQLFYNKVAFSNGMKFNSNGSLIIIISWNSKYLTMKIWDHSYSQSLSDPLSLAFKGKVSIFGNLERVRVRISVFISHLILSVLCRLTYQRHDIGGGSWDRYLSDKSF